MKILWILICIALMIASVKAQRNLNFSKPITNPEKRPRPMSWLRPPEERRRLSIFPKNNMKFVVTPKSVVEESTTGLTTKRPLMRKFIVHDKNERGSWYFAPREPLMQTKRFTVTLAPPRLVEDNSRNSLKSNDVIAEESKKIKTVINDSNTRQKSNKLQNKGNLIDVLRNKKSNMTTPKRFSQVNEMNKKTTGNKKTNLKLKNVPTSDNLSPAVHENYGALTSAKVFIGNEKESSGNNKLLPPSNIEDILGETIEGRLSYFNDKTLVGPYENSVIRLNKATSKGNEDVTPNIKGRLELLMENILNGTANSNNDMPVLNSDNDESVITKNHTTNKLDHYLLPEMTNEKQNNVENSANTSEQTIEILKAAPVIFDQVQNSSNEKQNIDVDTFEKYFHEPIVSTTDDHKSVPDLSDGPQTKSLFRNLESISETAPNNIKIKDALPAESESKPDKRVLHESLDEQYNNRKILNDVVVDDILSVTEVPSELFVNTSDIQANENVPIEALTNLPDNATEQEDPNESFFTGEYLSNKSVDDKFNNLTEEFSNDKSSNYTDEDTIEKITNYTGKEVSNESNVASEDTSNESIIDNLNRSTEETSKESQIDKSKNYIDEVLNESNMAGEDVSNEETSNESIIDKSNYTDEVSNEFAVDTTDGGISNESNMAVEEISIETDENLTEDIVDSGSLIDISLATEDISEEALIDKASNSNDEDVTPKPRFSSDRNIPRQFKRSNNIIEEENLPTTVSGFKYTGHEVSLSQDLSFKNINA